MIQGAATALDSLASLLDGVEGRRIVSVTAPAEIGDPAGAVFASLMAGDRWFCWEEPDDGFALAGVGSAHEVVSRGPSRFTDVARECAELLRGRACDEPDNLPAGAGPVWAGGFAFDPDGGAGAHWSSFPPALMVLPELSIMRRGGEA